jgi:hypothetical protein
MALITYAPFVDRVSGRLLNGSTTFSSNNGQGVIRYQGSVSNPNTVDQQAIRNIFSSLTKGWQLLTGAQRSAWSAWAVDHPVTNRLGRVVARTGLTAYVQVNSYMMMRGNVPGTTPPSQPTPTGVGIISNLIVAVTAGTVSVDFDGPAEYPAGSTWLVRMTRVLDSPALNPGSSLYRLWAGVNAQSFVSTADGTLTINTASLKYPVSDGDLVGISVSVVSAEGLESLESRDVVGVTAV